MLDKWCPTSKLSDIKLSHIQSVDIFFTCARTYLSTIHPTCPPLKLFFDILKSFPVLIMIEFWVLDNISAFSI